MTRQDIPGTPGDGDKHDHANPPAPTADATAASPPTTKGAPATLSLALWMREEGRLKLMERCCSLIDKRALSGRGIKGATIRAGYAAVRKVKPGIVGYSIGKFMPEFLEALQPFYARALEGCAPEAVPGAFRGILLSEKRDVAECLLKVTDSRIGQARAPVQLAYSALHKEAVHQIEAAVPELAELLEMHLVG